MNPARMMAAAGRLPAWAERGTCVRERRVGDRGAGGGPQARGISPRCLTWSPAVSGGGVLCHRRHEHRIVQRGSAGAFRLA
jgi:hypothetical protein